MSCTVSPSRRARLDEVHTALHEGLRPERFLCERLPDRPNPFVKMGQATEIQYAKKIPDDEPFYHHPWADQAQPTIGRDHLGHLWVMAGRYETTRRGIEDRVLPGMPTVEYLKQPYVQQEHLPLDAKELTTLGKLEWIKYKWYTPSGWQEDILRFEPSRAPEIAHDQKGNLHVLGGQYVITERGEENPMRTRSSRSSRRPSPFVLGGMPAKKARGRGRRANPSALANPSKRASGSSKSTMTSPSQRAQRMIMNSIVVGGVATITIVAMDMLLARVAPTWSLTTRALTKIGVGLAGGLGLAAAAPTVPSLAAGFSLGGVVSGLGSLYAQYVMPRIAALMTPAVQAPVVPPLVAAGSGAMLPAGIPAAYRGYSPAACAVR